MPPFLNLDEPLYFIFGLRIDRRIVGAKLRRAGAWDCKDLPKNNLYNSSRLSRKSVRSTPVLRYSEEPGFTGSDPALHGYHRESCF
jgi:hypothetical protein